MTGIGTHIGGQGGSAMMADESRREGSPLRIILVGRTGLDGRLRMDPGVEIVRVKSAIDAVGELSNPVDPEAASPAVVIVAPDADPAGPAHADAAMAREFTGALRRVDQGVRILRLEEGDGTAPVRGGYDGIISPEVSVDVLRAAVRGVGPSGIAPPQLPETDAAAAAIQEPATSNGAESGGASEGVETLVEAMSAAPRMVAMSEFGDETLVRTLMQGRDIGAAAVELIRQRLGARDVEFVPDSAQEPRERAAAASEAAVAWRGRVFGALRSAAAPVEALAAQASWLAGWLALREQHAQLREAAFTDPLTGAYNRRFFEHFLRSAIEQAAIHRRSLTVLMFDIDDFKVFNDRHGHGAGDDILKEVVRLLRSVIRPSDKVCRIGGDEFVVIFHEPDGPRNAASRPPASVFDIARRFQDAIAAHKFPKLGREAPGKLAISGGLATYPWDGRTAEELLARADELSLQSKKLGKNCITLGPGAERERENGGDRLPS